MVQAQALEADMYEGLEDLRERAEAWDAAACVELGDALLERAPCPHVPKDTDPLLRDLNWSLRFYNMKAADCPGGGDEQWEQRIRGARQAIDRRIADLNRGDPRRDEFLCAATRYFGMAAESGDPEGLWRLGWRCFLGEGTSVDEAYAFHCWWKAASLGHIPSMQKLADNDREVPLQPDAEARLAMVLSRVAEAQSALIRPDSRKLLMFWLEDWIHDVDLRQRYGTNRVLLPVRRTFGRRVRTAEAGELLGFVQLDSGLIVPQSVSQAAGLVGRAYVRPFPELYLDQS